MDKLCLMGGHVFLHCGCHLPIGSEWVAGAPAGLAEGETEHVSPSLPLDLADGEISITLRLFQSAIQWRGKRRGACKQLQPCSIDSHFFNAAIVSSVAMPMCLIMHSVAEGSLLKMMSIRTRCDSIR